MYKIKDKSIIDDIIKMYAVIDRGNFCSIHLGGISASYNLYNYLYKDSIHYLNRKKNIFKSAPQFGNILSVSGKIGEGCDANTEVSYNKVVTTVEHSE